jgi:hypothetical protein
MRGDYPPHPLRLTANVVDIFKIIIKKNKLFMSKCIKNWLKVVTNRI